MSVLDKIEKVFNKFGKLQKKVDELLNEEQKKKVKVLLDKALEKAVDEVIDAGVKALKDV